MLKVKLLEKVGRKGKIRIRFEDGPHPGLEEYVGTRQIVVRWADRKAFLRDEEREQSLAAHCATVNDRALSEAANAVLTASGEPSAWVSGGYLCMPEDELQRIADRSGLEGRLKDLHPLGFVDRHGHVHLPLEGAVAIARAFAAAEPETVVMSIEDHEHEVEIPRLLSWRALRARPPPRIPARLRPGASVGWARARDRDAAEGDRPA